MVLSLFALEKFYRHISSVKNAPPSSPVSHVRKVTPATVSRGNTGTWRRRTVPQNTEAFSNSHTNDIPTNQPSVTAPINADQPEQSRPSISKTNVTGSTVAPGLLSDPAMRREIALKIFHRQQTEQAAALKRAHDEEWDTTNGLMAIKNGRVYTYQTENAQAAISTAADLIRNTPPYNANGTNITICVWDEGGVRTTHQELAGRVTIMDGAALNDHSTHVAGTIAARGIVANAQGMAPSALINSYEWNLDLSEMTSRAMAAPGETSTVQISNHSYGHKSGWDYTVSPVKWYGIWGERESVNFGIYEWSTADWDELCWNAPYFLPFKSAGNDRGDQAPSPGQTFSYYDNGWKSKTYDSGTDPYSDNWDNGGFDTMPDIANAKNIITIGAVDDAVSNGVRSLNKAVMITYSSWGPTDDGRIKPDIVANGNSLYSCIATRNTSYGTKTGTSMATPNAAGSAALLLDYYTQIFPTQHMLSCSLKGLILHTADDLGNSGPDYVFGWGLMNTKTAADLIETIGEFPDAGNFRETMLTPSNMTHSYTFIWNQSDPIKATLCWIDPPAEPTSMLDDTSPKLVNDLDLRVIDPEGTTNFPYVLNPAIPTNTATTGDNNLDNVEQVYIDSPSLPGTYTITINVDGELATAYQPYSLFISSLTAPPTIAHTPLENTIETNTPYIIEASISAMDPLATNALFILWNTTGQTNSFTTNILTTVSNNLYRGTIPAHDTDTTIYYYIHAQTTNNLASTHPADAPLQLHRFDVARKTTLAITGSGGMEGGTVIPDYGLHVMASGLTAEASCSLYTSATSTHRFACSGWIGTGSTPLNGTSNFTSFRIDTDSTLEWQWLSQYSLLHTFTIPGTQTNIWFNEGSTGSTLTADSIMEYDGTNYHFTEWQINGMRWPSATNKSENPAAGFMMTMSYTASAIYLPTDQDSDTDNLPDWWELFYFGNLTQSYSSDPDLDGYLNLEEYQDRSDPRDQSSTPSGPAIDHTPLSDPQTTPAPWLISATVTDNYQTASVTLRWRRNALSWRQAPMALSSVTNQYTNSIPAPGIFGDTYEYKIEAADNAGYIAESGPHTFFVAYPVLNAGTSIIHVLLLPGTSSNISLSIQNNGNTNLIWDTHISSVGIIDDIEEGSNNWNHSGERDLWHITTNRYFSSSNAWYCGSSSTYKYFDSMDAYLVTPPIPLANSAKLTYRQWIATELQEGNYSWDGGVVEISTDGASYSPITPVGGYPHLIVDNPASPFDPDTPCFGGTGGWQNIEFDLSGNIGKSVRIRFRFGSDGYIVDEGWYIDDVQVTPMTTTNSWLSINVTNGNIPALSSTNVTVSFDSATLSSGEDDTVLWNITSNDPETPTNSIELLIRVRSIPLLDFTTSPAQVSTNGSGLVAISNTIYDIDKEACELELLYSTNAGATWSTAIIYSANASMGDVSITNDTTPQITAIITTNASAVPATNYVTATWATTNGSAPILLSMS